MKEARGLFAPAAACNKSGAVLFFNLAIDALASCRSSTVLSDSLPQLCGLIAVNDRAVFPSLLARREMNT
jgi:hypothetical protein